MGDLAKPVLPPYLYRYRRIRNDKEFDQELAAIKEHYLWCSTYKKLNDPMEGLYEATVRFQKDSAYTRFVRSILDAKQEIGICCFSDTYDNELMWTHYAGDHAGICVGYVPEPLVQGLPNGAQLVRMSYGLAPPSINGKDATNHLLAAHKILSHKKATWQYEREWRVLGRLGRINITSKRCVRELCLGTSMPEDYVQRFVDELANEPIRIYRMKLSSYSQTRTLVKALKGPASLVL